jgi:hypothetical protein
VRGHCRVRGQLRAFVDRVRALLAARACAPSVFTCALRRLRLWIVPLRDTLRCASWVRPPAAQGLAALRGADSQSAVQLAALRSPLCTTAGGAVGVRAMMCDVVALCGVHPLRPLPPRSCVAVCNCRELFTVPVLRESA